MISGFLDPREDGDEADEDGGDEEPAGLPVDGHEAGDPHLHFHDVAVEPVRAVEPADGDELDESHEEDGVGRSVVHQLEEEKPGIETDRNSGEEGDKAGDDHDLDSLIAEFGELVHEGGHEGFPRSADRRDGKEDEHEEEHEGEKRCNVHHSNGFGVDDEGQAGTSLDDVIDGKSFRRRNEADDAEDDDSGVQGGGRVAEGDEERVPVSVGVEPVVRGQEELAADGDTQTEENLSGGRVPDFNVA